MVIINYVCGNSLIKNFRALQGPAREREKREKERSELRDLVTFM
jgi:hypothetical protein